MTEQQRQTYRVNESIEGIASDGVDGAKRYWLNKGDTFEIESGINDGGYQGAFVITQLFGRIQLDASDLNKHCEAISTKEYDQLNPLVGKVDPEHGVWIK